MANLNECPQQDSPTVTQSFVCNLEGKNKCEVAKELKSVLAERQNGENTMSKEKVLVKEKIRDYATYVAGHAHDLRSPLNAIARFADMFILGYHKAGGEDRTAEYADAIKTSSDHLVHLINDLLDICRIDADKLELREGFVAVETFLANAAVMIRGRAEKADLTFNITVAPDLPYYYLDGQRMTQAVLNLLSNAVKFTPAGGKIELTAKQNKRNDLIIKVSDNGVGMKKRDVPKALMEFGQVGHGQNQVIPNTGLGLPLAKRLVELHGGTLKIKSEVDKGTEAILTLPTQRWKTSPT